MTTDRPVRPLPSIRSVNEGWFEGASQDELRLQVCADCSHVWFPPSSRCPSCLSTDWSWKAASGRGYIWSWIVMHQQYFSSFPEEVPYAVIVVKLDEGPLMVSKFVGTSDDEIACDARVRATTIDPGNGMRLPAFQLDS